MLISVKNSPKKIIELMDTAKSISNRNKLNLHIRFHLLIPQTPSKGIQFILQIGLMQINGKIIYMFGIDIAILMIFDLHIVSS